MTRPDSYPWNHPVMEAAGLLILEALGKGPTGSIFTLSIDNAKINGEEVGSWTLHVVCTKPAGITVESQREESRR